MTKYYRVMIKMPGMKRFASLGAYWDGETTLVDRLVYAYRMPKEKAEEYIERSKANGFTDYEYKVAPF